MSLRKKNASAFCIELERLQDYKLGELLNVNLEMIRYRLQAEIARLKDMEKIILSGESSRAQPESELKNIRQYLRTLEGTITVLDEISEWKGLDEDVWNRIAQLEMRELLSYDKTTLRSIVSGSQLISATKEASKVSREAPTAKQPTQPESITIEDREFIAISGDEWSNLLNKCFLEKRQIELPKNYLTERKSLSELLAAMVGEPPEKIRYVLSPKKHKYLFLMHNILYSIMKEKRKYKISPNSSEREIIEGDGGIFSIFQAEQKSMIRDENTIKKTYKLSVGQQEYLISKEIKLDGRRAKSITYFLCR